MRMLWVVAFLLFVTPAAFSQSSPSTGKDDRVAEEVKRLSTAESKAMLEKDIPALEKYFSDDFVVTNPFNKFLTKKQVLDGVRSGRIAFTSFERKVEYAHVYGDAVVLAGVETGVPTGLMPGAGQPMTLRFTSVWRKQQGAWREVARHASVVRPEAAE
ncbi:MAG TPA: nuclear transport factor 2 family protein [Terriglobales bacterium]|nr:nuclear transport factor 2 family protein [Terriglobales bacterium]